jgi:hypothetical protein
VNDYFAAARFHSEAKNVTQTEGFSQDAFRIVEWMKTDPELARIFAKDRRKILAGAFRLSARYLLDGGENVRALSHYLKSFWNHPPAVMKEFSRFAYSILSFLPAVKRKKADYLQKRLIRLTQDKMDVLYHDLTDYDGSPMKTGSLSDGPK